MNILRVNIQYKVLFVFFCIPLTLGAITQLAISFLLPDYNTMGLLNNRDWIEFHHSATLASKTATSFLNIFDGMIFNGTSVLIKILTAIYYIFGPYPFFFLIINAGLIAIASLAIFKTGRLHGLTETQAIFPPVFYALLPSHAILYSQIHKDTFTVLSICLLQTVILQILLLKKTSIVKIATACLLSIISAGVLALLIRPYFLRIMLITLLASGALLLLMKTAEKWIKMGLILTAIAILYGLAQTPTSNNLFYEGQPLPSIDTPATLSWSKTKYMPEPIERIGIKISDIRKGFSECCPNANSNIDTTIQFQSISSIVKYIPRAVQISLWGPFLRAEINNQLRYNKISHIESLVAKVESIILTACLIFLVYGASTHYDLRILGSITLLTFTIGTTIQALAIVNLGTLYRMKMSFTYFIYAASLIFVFCIHNKRRNAKNIKVKTELD